MIFAPIIRQFLRQRGTGRLWHLGALLSGLLVLLNVTTLSAAPQARIVYGTPVANGDIPWQVGVYELELGQLWHVCGGTLIDARWVVTAAHCFVPGRSSFIKIGNVDKTTLQDAQLIAVSRWILHPKYSLRTLNNDIALLELAQPVNLDSCGNHCQAIDPVTSVNVEAAMALANRAIVSGWGNRVAGEGIPETEDFPDILEQAELFLVDCLAGTRYGAGDITANMFCAAAPDYSRDSCQGDSGGPLVVANPDGTGTYLLAGIISWGGGCAVPDLPGVYTRVANYTHWIGQETRLPCCVNEPAPATGKRSGKSSGSLEGLLIALLAPFALLRRFRRRSAGQR